MLLNNNMFIIIIIATLLLMFSKGNIVVVVIALCLIMAYIFYNSTSSCSSSFTESRQTPYVKYPFVISRFTNDKKIDHIKKTISYDIDHDNNPQAYYKKPYVNHYDNDNDENLFKLNIKTVSKFTNNTPNDGTTIVAPSNTNGTTTIVLPSTTNGVTTNEATTNNVDTTIVPLSMTNGVTTSSSATTIVPPSMTNGTTSSSATTIVPLSMTNGTTSSSATTIVPLSMTNGVTTSSATTIVPLSSTNGITTSSATTIVPPSSTNEATTNVAPSSTKVGTNIVPIITNDGIHHVLSIVTDNNDTEFNSYLGNIDIKALVKAINSEQVDTTEDFTNYDGNIDKPISYDNRYETCLEKGVIDGDEEAAYLNTYRNEPTRVIYGMTRQYQNVSRYVKDEIDEFDRNAYWWGLHEY